MALWYELPSDGWPHLTSWLATAKEIYMAGFESLREPFEVKLRDGTDGMAKLIVTKGVGRASIILFGILYTYLEFAADLTAGEMKDFCRPMGFVWGGDNLGSPPVNNLQNTWPCRQRFLVSSICHPIITQLCTSSILGTIWGPPCWFWHLRFGVGTIWNLANCQSGSWMLLLSEGLLGGDPPTLTIVPGPTFQLENVTKIQIASNVN